MPQLLEKLKTKIMPSDADKLKALRSQLESAESDRDAAHAALGAALLDEQPATDAVARIEAADKRIVELGAMVQTVETRIQVAADRKREDAKAAQREVLRSALAKVQSDAKALERDFETLQQHTAALKSSVNVALAAASTLGADNCHSMLANGRAKYKFYAMYHASALPGCAVPYVEKLAPYAENFPKPAELK